MKNETSVPRSGGSFQTNKVVAVVLMFATAALLASCAEETAGTTGDATAPAGTTVEGTTVETTAGTTTGGTTGAGTTGGTTVSNATTGATTAGGTTSGGTTVTTATTGGSTAGATSGGTITSLQSIVSETDKRSLIGRRVELDGVQVRNSVGATGFLVGASGAQQLFVVPAEATNVQQGQVATIAGTLEEIPGVSEAQQRFGVGETAAALLQSQVVYLDADRVQ